MDHSHNCKNVNYKINYKKNTNSKNQLNENLQKLSKKALKSKQRLASQTFYKTNMSESTNLVLQVINLFCQLKNKICGT